MTSRRAYLLIVAFTLWRVVLLPFASIDLFVDEAQYWLWSQNLDIGYYSKPPMIAWVIRAVTDLAGSDDAFWIRVSGPLLHMLTAFALVAAARRIASDEVAAWSGVAYVTAPAVALSSILFSTDVVLLFFVAVALWAYFGLVQRRSAGLALVMGVAFGAAFLSKYAVLFLLPGGLIALALLPSARIGWRDFLIAASAALLVALPNLWWNLSHQGTTVRHTQEIARWSEMALDPVGAAGFFLSQFGVVGPILFGAMLVAAVRMLRGRGEPYERLLAWLSTPVVLLITFQALIAKAEANWGAIAYVAGIIVAVLILQRHWPRGLSISLAIGGAVSLMLPVIAVFAEELVLPDGREALERFLGRSEVSRRVGEFARAAGIDIVVSDNRDMTADLFHTLRKAPLRLYARPPKDLPRSYYEQEFALPSGVTGKVLFLGRRPPTCASEQPEQVASWVPEHGYYRARTIYLYTLSADCLRVPSGAN